MTRQGNAGVVADVKLQVMMTLAGLASTAQNPLPGESTAQQTKRIQAGIVTQLAMKSLATAGQWTLQWVGQSGDGGNMAFIAQNDTDVAVVFRGTVNVLDLLEDDDVFTLQDFVGGAAYGKVSRGSNYAFNEIVKNTNLVSALQAVVKAGSGAQTVNVIGHSLGGAMATMFSLYLRDQLNGYNCTVQCYTFAAPSAGDSTFATSFNNQKPAPVCVWNAYDVVPNAWASLEKVKDSFYPQPGPAATSDIQSLLQDKINKAKGWGGLLNGPCQYTQTVQEPPLNPNYTTYDPDYVGKNGDSTDTLTADWKAQMAFQHAANTYLGLLGLAQNQLLPNAPTVTSVSPNNGHTGDTVTISGQNFTPDCTVSFYLNKGFAAATSVVVKNATTITCTVPAGILIADVLVSNCAGASNQSNADQFKYDL